MKLLILALVCFEWYGPGRGSIYPPQPKVARETTSATYKHYRGRYELKVKTGSSTKTYRGYGAPHVGWMNNPYVKRTNKTSRTGRTRLDNSTNVLRVSKPPLRP